MSCPEWDKCDKKGCIENERCINSDYWHSLSTHVMKVQTKKQRRLFHYLDRNNCNRVESVCDKDSTCKILGQCIFTISAVKDNDKLKKCLSYGWTMKEVIKILAKHNPTPMKSYYPQKRRHNSTK